MMPKVQVYSGPMVVEQFVESLGAQNAVKTWDKIRETTSRTIGLQDVPLRPRDVNVGLAKAPVTSYLNHSDIVIVINQSDIGVM